MLCPAVTFLTNVADLPLPSQPRVPLSVETCQRPTPWFVWPMMTMARTQNLAKWPRSHPSWAGVWRTNWRVPAPSAFPQQITLMPFPGIKPSPAQTPTVAVPYTDQPLAYVLSARVVQYVRIWSLVWLYCWHSGTSKVQCQGPWVTTGMLCCCDIISTCLRTDCAKYSIWVSMWVYGHLHSWSRL